ncbi:Dabb family protein [Salsuginibacillus kocurii]|uniref:Dabb family protein n=1 Tax=Salsuginibacillus kocurii TaxID=427078 RepID=UPI00037F16A0|nr:Dabb family protein [Salsuginibacillus kocurii]
MIEHVVILKFKEETTEAQRDEAAKKLQSLENEIPGIIDLKAGRNFSERGQGFDVGLTVRFEDKAALEAYGPHPKHKEVTSYLKEIGMVDIIVMDFEL